jgi:hypothetical protein
MVSFIDRDIPDKHILRSQGPIFTGDRAEIEKPFKLERHHQVPDKISVFGFSQAEIDDMKESQGSPQLLFAKADCCVYRWDFKTLRCT